jgi:hypothetical protein
MRQISQINQFVGGMTKKFALRRILRFLRNPRKLFHVHFLALFLATLLYSKQRTSRHGYRMK